MEEIIQKKHIEKLLSFMKEEAYKPLTVQELEEAFGIEEAADFKEFVKALVLMEEKGLVVRTRSNRYGLPEKNESAQGKAYRTFKRFLRLLCRRKRARMIFFYSADRAKWCAAW
ncbi:hypothetical protein GCM10020331_027850 [Ectobacillus funiculus]